MSKEGVGNGTVARAVGNSARDAVYVVPDDQLAAGSTLGAPRVTTVIKANGSIEKVFSPDMGETVFGTLGLRHFDADTGMHLEQSSAGTFTIHAAHQQHDFVLSNGLHVCETIFAPSTGVRAGSVDAPGVFYAVEFHNVGAAPVTVDSYAFCLLRGTTTPDIQAEYDSGAGGFVVWNKSKRNQVRVFAASSPPESHEITLDMAKAVSNRAPGQLSNEITGAGDPLAVMRHLHSVDPGATVTFHYLLTFGKGRKEARANARQCPHMEELLQRTRAYYRDMLGRSVVMTPDPLVNRGVLWAKANMLRIENKAPTGWAFTNDPTRSNNSVARDTAWFGFGADYFTPEFVHDSLLAYIRLQEDSGKIVEYYDIRNSKTADYGLNINDDTPLIVLALWHHYNTTGNLDFLKDVYPAAVKACRYILSQRNRDGLVWVTSRGVSDWGIASWRNVIPNYRISGAVTELNSECYAALQTLSHMARVLEHHEESGEFAAAASALRDAINTHLLNPENGLYYLNIDVDGQPRSNITSDLVFPVIFGVASDRTAGRIVGRLSNADFWTPAGMHTTPRDAPDYTPDGGWGLLGGVWVGVSFWYAFAAAKYSPEFMAYALSTTFRNYSTDPLHTNTVPGQFSEWLNGETLVNVGMMLSPWFPPRYLWAALEGMAGLDLSGGSVNLEPHLAPQWKWLAVQNVPYRGRRLTWVCVGNCEPTIYTNFVFPGGVTSYVAYEQDITEHVRVTGKSVCGLGLMEGQNLLLFAGNTEDRTVATSISVGCSLQGKYSLRRYDSLMGEWTEHNDLITAGELERGLTIDVERGGFCVMELRQVE